MFLKVRDVKNMVRTNRADCNNRKIESSREREVTLDIRNPLGAYV